MERAIVAGLNTETTDSYLELTELAITAGAEIVGSVIQNRPSPDPMFFIGKGKVDELILKAKELKTNMVIFNHNLKPKQQSNLEEATKLKIVDRCTLILDIFARHARSNEGKLQVELAQLSYLLPRLAGKGVEMSQTGGGSRGGIGTIGPGETKLEVDRRAIRNRIDFLKEKLEVVKKHRSLQRDGRKAKGFLTAAFVGYTNSGKSTLLNALTRAGVLAENKLFSTLDTTTRKLNLRGGEKVLLTDTVGFIRNLPAELIASFRATLEETKFADILIIVLDTGKTDIEVQNDTIYKELKALDVLKKPIITVLNKIDIADASRILRLEREIEGAISISAANKTNLDILLAKISLVYNDLLTNS
ncbi:MAG: GTPase HflX [Candidatus Firestonebacteria bacterium]